MEAVAFQTARKLLLVQPMSSVLIPTHAVHHHSRACIVAFRLRLVPPDHREFLKHLYELLNYEEILRWIKPRKRLMYSLTTFKFVLTPFFFKACRFRVATWRFMASMIRLSWHGY